eukprot:5957383-Heterocapsa_arctica.AAC.1
MAQSSTLGFSMGRRQCLFSESKGGMLLFVFSRKTIAPTLLQMGPWPNHPLGVETRKGGSGKQEMGTTTRSCEQGGSPKS